NQAMAGAHIIYSKWPREVVGFKDYRLKEEELVDLISNVNLSGQTGLQSAPLGAGHIYVGNIEMALNKVGVDREKLLDAHVKSISRKTADGYYYFIANHENRTLDKELEFKFGAENVLFMNPLNGEVKKGNCKYDGQGATFRVFLKPGSSMIVRFTNKKVDTVPDFIYPKTIKTQELNNIWDFKALKGGPELPPEMAINELKFWTDLPDTSYTHFAGIGEYSTVFSLSSRSNNQYILKFSEVETTAKVFINEKEAGTLWSYPYELDVSEYIQQGKNDLRVEVCNLGSNRIRYMDQQGVNWKKFHNINIVDLNYKKLDASNWDVLSSGLNGKVELLEIENH
ncbi:MAG: hypothetical protein N4A46_09635, partial [Schleiferiaceae bacterium]|nr:hypothetical protein [Schleiferiaceae bacterium]